LGGLPELSGVSRYGGSKEFEEEVRRCCSSSIYLDRVGLRLKRDSFGWGDCCCCYWGRRLGVKKEVEELPSGGKWDVDGLLLFRFCGESINCCYW